MGRRSIRKPPDSPARPTSAFRVYKGAMGREPKTVRLTDPEIDASIPVGLNGHCSIDQKNMFLADLFLGIIDCEPRRGDCPAGGGCLRFSGIAPSHDPTRQD